MAKKMISFLVLFTAIMMTDQAHSSEREALLAIDNLASKLKGELKAALKKSPEEALKVCHTKAQEVTKEIQLKNLFFGRVSLKTRNPNNKPKKWMLETMKAYHAGKITAPHTVVSINKDRMGVIKPIKTGGLCLTCHGTNVSKNISKKLSELYPNDKATGYKNGEIRGFFWADYEKPN